MLSSANLFLDNLVVWLEDNFSNQLRYSIFYSFIIHCYTLIKSKAEYLSGSNFHKLIGFANILLIAFFSLSLGLPQFASDKGYFGLIVVFGFVLALTNSLIKKDYDFKFVIVDFLVLTYFAINIISTFASAYFIPSLNGLAKLVIFIMSYFWFRLTLNAKNRFFIVNEIILLAFIMSVYGIYQYKTGVKALATWEDPTLDIHQTRIFSTLGNPNLLAGFLTPILFLNLAFLANGLNKKNILQTIVYLISALIIFMAVVFTGCRGVYLALPISLFLIFSVLYIVLIRNLSLNKIVVSTSILVGLTLCCCFFVMKIPYVKDRFSTIFSGREHSSNSYRLNVWQASLKMVKDNYVFGIGPGNKTFRLAYGLYMKSGYDALGTYCVPLEITVEDGIFGLIVFIVLIKFYLLKLHKQFWTQLSQNNNINWFILGLVGAILAMIFHGFVDTVFFRPQINFIFWLLLCLNLD